MYCVKTFVKTNCRAMASQQAAQYCMNWTPMDLRMWAFRSLQVQARFQMKLCSVAMKIAVARDRFNRRGSEMIPR